MEESETDLTVPLVSQMHVVNADDEDADLQSELSLSIEDKTSEGSIEDKTSEGRVPESNLGFESLDYDPIFNIVYENTRKDMQSRQLYGYTGLTLAKWSITISIGILVGLVAYFIEMCQEFLLTRKKELTHSIMGCGLIVSFIAFASASVLLVLVASCLVIFWAPSAAGGGVTLVMAYLNGTDIPEFFQFKTLVTKIIGSICSISSGLLLGQEGPMVHIGAAIASLMTWMHCHLPTRKNLQQSASRHCCSTLKPNALPFEIYSDKDRREFISAGTAAGLAAAFGAPIGGVLYSLEEASSFWSRKVMWRSLICCTCATMVLALVNSWEFSTSLPGSMSFREVQPVFIVRDLPLFVVTSVLTGILGVVINSAHAWLARIRPLPNRKVLRIIEACMVTLVSVMMMFVFPLFLGQCMVVPSRKTPSGTMDDHYWFKYTCPAPNQTDGVKYYNDLATLFFSLPRQSMQELYGMEGARTEFTIKALGIHSLSALFLFILAYGVATPGGIFMPAMLVGASFGGFLGRIFQVLLPSAHVEPGLHALVGTAAMLGSFLRASISLVVIMVEGFSGVDFILPLIVAIVISNWVAHHFHQAGAYEADLERLGNVCFLQSEPPRELSRFSAADLMSSNVVCFHEVVTVAEVLTVLRTRRHNGFPVLRHTHSSDAASGGGKFVGLILRHQLLLLLEQRAFIEVDSQVLFHTHKYSWETHISEDIQFLDHAMRLYHQYHYPHRRHLSSQPMALDDLGADEIVDIISSRNTESGHVSNGRMGTIPNAPEKVLALDLRPFMNRAPISVRRECSAQRVYIIFRTLGLRHLCVTDSHNKVIGIITRKDIGMALKQGRLSKDKRFQHWDSDIRSFNEQKEHSGPREKIFDLP